MSRKSAKRLLSVHHFCSCPTETRPAVQGPARADLPRPPPPLWHPSGSSAAELLSHHTLGGAWRSCAPPPPPVNRVCISIKPGRSTAVEQWSSCPTCTHASLDSPQPVRTAQESVARPPATGSIEAPLSSPQGPAMSVDLTWRSCPSLQGPRQAELPGGLRCPTVSWPRPCSATDRRPGARRGGRAASKCDAGTIAHWQAWQAHFMERVRLVYAEPGASSASRGPLSAATSSTVSV